MISQPTNPSAASQYRPVPWQDSLLSLLPQLNLNQIISKFDQSFFCGGARGLGAAGTPPTLAASSGLSPTAVAVVAVALRWRCGGGAAMLAEGGGQPAAPSDTRAKPGIHPPFVVRTTPSLVPIPPRTIPNLETSLPAELHRRGSREEPACPHACSCSRRAETGTNLASLDLGAGRTAAAVGAGENHVHPAGKAPPLRDSEAVTCSMEQSSPTPREPFAAEPRC